MFSLDMPGQPLLPRFELSENNVKIRRECERVDVLLYSSLRSFCQGQNVYAKRIVLFER